ncbi:MAG: mechanosensitive ion channel family protein [Pseudomonadota bacterium]
MAGIWWGGLNLLSLPANVLVVLLVAAKFLASFAGVWGAYRLVDVISAFFREMASKTESKVDDMLIPLFSRMAKIFITVVGIVFIANNLNVNVTSLLAGLGIAGMAFALAAKDVVENLFGSITVLWDQPFVVGDWVVIGDIEGTVEQIGFRSTRVRTFYNSLISLPNSRLITAHVDNMGKRRYRRFSCRLGVAYDTPPERMESFCEGIREIVKIHPYTRKDYFHVYFNSYEANSLDIMVYVFFDVPDWAAELQERERLLLDILRLSKRIGVEFAYPTQTIYWKQASTDPVQPADGEFSLAMTQDDAFKVGRAEAEAIVRESTGLGVKPPHRPSGLGSGDGDGDGGEG